MNESVGLLRDLGRFCFFTGKGGVGKTSLACATAVRLADQGKRVLLISTDPSGSCTTEVASFNEFTPLGVSVDTKED